MVAVSYSSLYPQHQTSFPPYKSWKNNHWKWRNKWRRASHLSWNTLLFHEIILAVSRVSNKKPNSNWVNEEGLIWPMKLKDWWVDAIKLSSKLQNSLTLDQAAFLCAGFILGKLFSSAGKVLNFCSTRYNPTGSKGFLFFWAFLDKKTPGIFFWLG